MAGLVPAIYVLLISTHGWRLGLLHDQSAQRHSVCRSHQQFARRAYEHREGLIDGFTKHYGLKILVYAERFDDIREAIQREKNIKHWPRAWKVRLIHAMNPEWEDLYDSLI